jgi:catechol 2,3-dioxygenase-like lactoylglutathione lyase family enzyme
MIDHIGFLCSDYARSRAFYERALAPLGLAVAMVVRQEESGGYEGCGFGKDGKREFWIGSKQGDGRTFRAPDRSSIDAFPAAALAAGGCDNGAPGLRPRYHPNYYGAFVLDPDGHTIEAVCHAPETSRAG